VVCRLFWGLEVGVHESFLQFCLVSQVVATFGRVGLIHKFLQSFCLILQFGLELGAMYVKIGKMLQDITPLEMDTYNSKINK
jgi:hypothetical protein